MGEIAIRPFGDQRRAGQHDDACGPARTEANENPEAEALQQDEGGDQKPIHLFIPNENPQGDQPGSMKDDEQRVVWTFSHLLLDGCVCEIVDREDFGSTIPGDLRLGEVRCERWGGFVFVNLDPGAEPLLEFLSPLPELLAPYRFADMRLRGRITTILPANWKVVVDAFNEAYHVQGTHPQLLPWTDDVSIAYEQLGKHAHYGRLPNARRLLRPSPRLGLSDNEIDEAAILRGLVSGLGGASSCSPAGASTSAASTPTR